ncbi:hypothetical protein JCM8547_006485 [Rhodosporidiobolus lusitaniae]
MRFSPSLIAFSLYGAGAFAHTTTLSASDASSTGSSSISNGLSSILSSVGSEFGIDTSALYGLTDAAESCISGFQSAGAGDAFSGILSQLPSGVQSIVSQFGGQIESLASTAMSNPSEALSEAPQLIESILGTSEVSSLLKANPVISSLVAEATGALNSLSGSASGSVSGSGSGSGSGSAGGLLSGFLGGGGSGSKSAGASVGGGGGGGAAATATATGTAGSGGSGGGAATNTAWTSYSTITMTGGGAAAETSTAASFGKRAHDNVKREHMQVARRRSEGSARS